MDSVESLIIPFGSQLVVTKEMYDRFADAVIEKALEKLPQVKMELGGIKVVVHQHIPKNMAMIVGPDPDFPGGMRVLKILKFED